MLVKRWKVEIEPGVICKEYARDWHWRVYIDWDTLVVAVKKEQKTQALVDGYEITFVMPWTMRKTELRKGLQKLKCIVASIPTHGGMPLIDKLHRERLEEEIKFIQYAFRDRKEKRDLCMYSYLLKY